MSDLLVDSEKRSRTGLQRAKKVSATTSRPRTARGDGQRASGVVRKQQTMDLAAAPVAPVVDVMGSTRGACASAHMTASGSPFLLESASP